MDIARYRRGSTRDLHHVARAVFTRLVNKPEYGQGRGMAQFRREHDDKFIPSTTPTLPENELVLQEGKKSRGRRRSRRCPQITKSIIKPLRRVDANHTVFGWPRPSRALLASKETLDVQKTSGSPKFFKKQNFYLWHQRRRA